jgi:two-component system chemotaxis sensor kinase CheA
MVITGPESERHRFQQLFLEESAEHLETIETGILALKTPQPVAVHEDSIGSILRAAHTIKGNAGMMKYSAAGRMMHHVEGLLERLRAGVLQLDSEVISLLLKATDCTREILQRRPDDPEDETALKVCHDLARQAAIEPGSIACNSTQEGPPQSYHIVWKPPADCLMRAADPIQILQALAAVGTLKECACDIDELPRIWSLAEDRCGLSWRLELTSGKSESELREIFTSLAVDDHLAINVVQRVAPQQERPSNPSPQPKEDTIRVASAKLDTVFNLMGELVIAQSMASQILREPQGEATGWTERMTRAFEEVERNTRELQDRVMELRLVPIDLVFRRFPRLVHELCRQLNKHINLDMSGSETQIDKCLVEKLNEPLVHLIRNCADHGIEPPEERILAGKPARGEIRLTAGWSSGTTFIEIEDDGRGLNTERIRNRAYEVGLISRGAEIADSEIHSLIFHSGFTTAERLSSISGRGVGMDIVRTSLEKLSGKIQVQTKPGVGTLFRITLPMTLAIVEALLVRCHGQIVAIPLPSIVECTHPDPGQIRMVPDEMGEAQELYILRDRTLAVVHPACLDTSSGSIRTGLEQIALILEQDSHQYVLLVDEVLGQQRVVIKSLETNYKRVAGLQGVTVLGDGQVALVLDVGAMIQVRCTHRALQEER